LVWFFPASYFGATTTITIGNGGAGGVAQTVNATDGNAGSIGGLSIVGNISPLASTGVVDVGGTTTTAAGGTGTSWNTFSVNAPYNYSVNASVGGSLGSNTTGTDGANLQIFVNSANSIQYAPTGGGGGSGADTGTARQAGVGGNILNGNLTTLVAGGAGGIRTGTIAGQPGAVGLVTGGTITGGAGGGGGGGGSTVGGIGGVGGVPGGGGGGGGGGITNNNSGAGGAGGKGMVIIIEYT
jgi:hypothetical protein